MADKKSVISQLQSVGEDALGKLAGSDTARNALQGAMQLKDRVNSLSPLEGIEKRLDAIEKRLAVLEGTKKTATRSSATGGKTAAASSKPRTAAKPSADKAKS